MQKIKAILVDDEESARDVLQNLLLRFCPEVELLAKCEHVLQAVEAIREMKPDLVFLDIEMPNYAGYELVNFFQDIDFEIIFVTAYDQYAIRAFELAAIDYLLKPVDIERLKAAVARVQQQFDMKFQAQRLKLLSASLETNQVKSILVSDKGYQQVVAFEHIIAIEAQESYCIIHTAEKKHIISKNLKHFETLLESVPQFIRVHKSWIINRAHMVHYSRTDLSIQLTGGILARLSKYKKADFEAALLS
ncbi:MAG TPA: LytTR family DNA-binding domain-containing protein [Bacteroidia bacterium]|nr:LytTR family DNA-binding domain-containing protein [Bacteroidia bacterium]